MSCLSPSGNTNDTGTLVPRKVVLEDGEGNVYSLSGAVWFGGTSNAQQGTYVSIVVQDDSTDPTRINLPIRITPTRGD